MVVRAALEVTVGEQITLQIFTGGYVGDVVSFEQVRDKLDEVLEMIPASRVVMGWALEPDLYRRAARYLAGKDIEFYLWLPVFSETGLVKNCSPVVGSSGQTAAHYHLGEGENFEFYCPADPLNADNVISLFTEQFGGVGFDGVFLDKIRYPSFANGRDGGFSCFCPRCVERYERGGLDVVRLRERIDQMTDVPFGVTSYADGVYAFSDELWQRYFALRSQVVADALSRMCQTFRQMGYRIGMDVFAPFLGEFVGQDIPRLSALCDFVKPMMYRTTWAPAGPGFEADALLTQTRAGDGGRAAFGEILGADLDARPFDLDFSVRQLAWLAGACTCPVEAGVEINRRPSVVDADPAYIRETLAAFSRTDANGYVLSWNLLEAPADNVDAVAGFLR